MNRFRSVWSSVLLSAALQLLHAVPGRAEVQSIAYDHFNEKGADASLQLPVKPGDRFIVSIVNTCKAKFKATHAGIPRGPATTPGVAAPVGADCKATDKIEVEIVHESKFRGYLISLESAGGAAVKAASPVDDAKVETLPAETMLIVEIPDEETDFAFAGGFSISDLTDRRYALVQRTVDGEELNFAVRDEEAEDDYDLGLTAMIHGRHSKWWDWFALSFGLGVSNANEVNYFVGPTARIGKKGFITLGYQFGPRTRLPNGVQEADLDNLDPDLAVEDANALNSLPTKTEDAIFLSFSYTFLGNGLDALKKPFAPAKEAAK